MSANKRWEKSPCESNASSTVKLGSVFVCSRAIHCPSIDDAIDYDLEMSVINSVIEEQWGNSLETHDIDGYMSAIWEDDFFYVSDMDTPNNLGDDIIFRGGSQEREGALRMFDAFHAINLNLSKNGDIEFLSETLAMVDYDYNLKTRLPDARDIQSIRTHDFHRGTSRKRGMAYS